MKLTHAAVAGLALAIAHSGSALAQGVVRHDAGDFPIAAAVEVPQGKTIVYLSGTVPSVVDANATKDSLEAFGNTKTQTVDVLEQINKQLAALGLGLKDVVKMQVFLVGGPETGGKMDFDGFMEGYTQFFGASAGQPNLPARSTFQVAALAHPAWRVEIEVIAVRP